MRSLRKLHVAAFQNVQFFSVSLLVEKLFALEWKKVEIRVGRLSVGVI